MFEMPISMSDMYQFSMFGLLIICFHVQTDMCTEMRINHRYALPKGYLLYKLSINTLLHFLLTNLSQRFGLLVLYLPVCFIPRSMPKWMPCKLCFTQLDTTHMPVIHRLHHIQATSLLTKQTLLSICFPYCFLYVIDHCILPQQDSLHLHIPYRIRNIFDQLTGLCARL